MTAIYFSARVSAGAMILLGIMAVSPKGLPIFVFMGAVGILTLAALRWRGLPFILAACAGNVLVGAFWLSFLGAAYQDTRGAPLRFLVAFAVAVATLSIAGLMMKPPLALRKRWEAEQFQRDAGRLLDKACKAERQRDYDTAATMYAEVAARYAGSPSANDARCQLGVLKKEGKIGSEA